MIVFAVVLAGCDENPLAAPGGADPVAGGTEAAQAPATPAPAGEQQDTGNVSVTPMPPGQSPFEPAPEPPEAPEPPPSQPGAPADDTSDGRVDEDGDGLADREGEDRDADGVADEDADGPDEDGDGQAEDEDGQDNDNDGIADEDGASQEDEDQEVAEVRVESDEEVENEVPAPDGVLDCDDSGLPPGEGRANKGGTCVDTSLGEIRENPVFPVVDAPESAAEGEDFTFAVQVVGNGSGLNGFTQEGDTGKAGITFLERMTTNDTLHCHTGAAETNASGAPLTATYEAAFSGLEGIGDEFLVTFANLDAGTYVGAVWCTGAGHVPLGTAVASTIIPSTSFRFTIN